MSAFAAPTSRARTPARTTLTSERQGPRTRPRAPAASRRGWARQDSGRRGRFHGRERCAHPHIACPARVPCPKSTPRHTCAPLRPRRRPRPVQARLGLCSAGRPPARLSETTVRTGRRVCAPPPRRWLPQTARQAVCTRACVCAAVRRDPSRIYLRPPARFHGRQPGLQHGFARPAAVPRPATPRHGGCTREDTRHRLCSRRGLAETLRAGRTALRLRLHPATSRRLRARATDPRPSRTERRGLCIGARVPVVRHHDLRRTHRASPDLAKADLTGAKHTCPAAVARR